MVIKSLSNRENLKWKWCSSGSQSEATISRSSVKIWRTHSHHDIFHAVTYHYIVIMKSRLCRFFLYFDYEWKNRFLTIILNQKPVEKWLKLFEQISRSYDINIQEILAGFSSSFYEGRNKYIRAVKSYSYRSRSGSEKRKVDDVNSVEKKAPFLWFYAIYGFVSSLSISVRSLYTRRRWNKRLKKKKNENSLPHILPQK